MHVSSWLAMRLTWLAMLIACLGIWFAAVTIGLSLGNLAVNAVAEWHL